MRRTAKIEIEGTIETFRAISSGKRPPPGDRDAIYDPVTRYICERSTWFLYRGGSRPDQAGSKRLELSVR